MVYGSAKFQIKVFLVVMEVKQLILSMLVLALWRFLENFEREMERFRPSMPNL